MRWTSKNNVKPTENMYEIVQENTLKIEKTKKHTIAYNRVSSRSQVYDLIVDD